MAKYMYGCSKIEMGAIAGDGGMGTTLTDIGDVYQDSVELSQEDPGVTEFYSETKDTAILSIEKAGKKTLKFSIVDMTPSNLAKFLGGTATTVGTSPVFNILKTPDSIPVIEQSLKISTTDGGYLQIPRAKLVSKINAKLSKSSMVVVDVTATILQPTKAGEAPLTIALL